MTSSALFCLHLKHGLAWAASLLLLAGPVRAEPSLTPRSVVPAYDALKQTYVVKNFRLGGQYDLAQPQRFEC